MITIIYSLLSFQLIVGFHSLLVFPLYPFIYYFCIEYKVEWNLLLHHLGRKSFPFINLYSRGTVKVFLLLNLDRFYLSGNFNTSFPTQLILILISAIFYFLLDFTTKESMKIGVQGVIYCTEYHNMKCVYILLVCISPRSTLTWSSSSIKP
jgi:hypothetical protein